ncbi:hypothetical protein NDU88_006517 [Pleurodeles waltl]|uniref:Uncharacterized protein n=1 Tax=Pleurodeles waltl TaxID=8319 RepID=A0AAV7SPU5_PLEWA|nr:hypothetical protein NDU88_006517 [Pleurodeles waltl]
MRRGSPRQPPGEHASLPGPRSARREACRSQGAATGEGSGAGSGAVATASRLGQGGGCHAEGPRSIHNKHLMQHRLIGVKLGRSIAGDETGAASGLITMALN